MGDVRYKSQSNQTNQPKTKTLGKATRWLRSFFRHNLRDRARTIDWYHEPEMVKRGTRPVEDEMGVPGLECKCVIRLFGHDGTPVYFTLLLVAYKSGLLKIGGHIDEEYQDPGAN